MSRRYVESYLGHLESVKHASVHTLRNYRIDLMQFADYLDTLQLDLKEVTKNVVRQYLAQKKVSKATLARKLSSMRSFFLHLKKSRVIPVSPMESVRRPKLDKRLPRCVTPEEVEHFFSMPDLTSVMGLRDRAMMELFYSSGIRLSELAAIDQGEIDFKTRTLKVRGKGKKERVVPVTSRAIRWIQRYREDPECEPKGERALFLNRFGKRLSMRSIDRQFKRYMQASGLAAQITPHALRHSIATHLLDQGMDLKSIQKLLGHQTLAATTIYTGVSPALKRKEYTKSHPLAAKEKSS